MTNARIMLARPILVTFRKDGIEREEYVSHVSFKIAEGLRLDPALREQFDDAIINGRITDAIAQRMMEIDPECFAREYRAAIDRADAYFFHKLRLQRRRDAREERQALASAGDDIGKAVHGYALDEALADAELADVMAASVEERYPFAPSLERLS